MDGPAGRANQKRRTRAAIVAAARDLITGSAEVTMPAVAQAALVSEATAYRYFPDLVSLLRDALEGTWPSPAEALASVEDSADAVARIGVGTERLLRHVQAYQGAVRAMIAASVVRPRAASIRPGYRFGIIDHALAPLEGSLGRERPEAFRQLKQDLAIVVSAEALFTLTDLCELSPDEAIASAVRSARTLTAAAISECSASHQTWRASASCRSSVDLQAGISPTSGTGAIDGAATGLGVVLALTGQPYPGLACELD